MNEFPMETPPPRVLFVIPGEARGSSMIFARRQAESLAEEGVEVDSFYLRSRTSPLALAREFHRLRGHIQAFRPALIHAHFGTVTAALSALAAGKLPLVITYRGGDLNRQPFGLRVCLGTPVFATGRAARHAHRLRQPRPAGASVVATLPRGHPAHRVRFRFFRPQPGHLARATPRLARRSARGPVQCRSRSAHQAPGSRAASRRRGAAKPARRASRDPATATFIPRLVPSYMNASDCLLVTSDSEGSPAVLQEALACALPVVSVDAGDAAERLRGVAPSRIVSRDPQVIGRALAEIAASPRRSNGPRSIAGLSLRSTARQLRRLYGEILGLPSCCPVQARLPEHHADGIFSPCWEPPPR